MKKPNIIPFKLIAELLCNSKTRKGEPVFVFHEVEVGHVINILEMPEKKEGFYLYRDEEDSTYLYFKGPEFKIHRISIPSLWDNIMLHESRFLTDHITSSSEEGDMIVAFGFKEINEILQMADFNYESLDSKRKKMFKPSKFRNEVGSVLNQIRKKSNIEDFIDLFLNDAGFSELEAELVKPLLSERYLVAKLSDLSLTRMGNTCRGVIKTPVAAIKIDKASRLMKEKEFYQNVGNVEFSQFCPSFIGDSPYAEFEEIGFLAIKNLDNEPIEGYEKANFLYGTRFDNGGLEYCLFLMGLFHKSLNLSDKKYNSSLGIGSYSDLNGDPHHVTAADPGINIEGEALKRFFGTQIKDRGFVRVIDYYNDMLKSLHSSGSLRVVDGDWKPENIYKGYKVDFSCIGFGLEIDDLAYYLSDHSLRLNFSKFKKLINVYSAYRANHDPKFKTDFLACGSSSDKMYSSAWLRQLVLRHAVMKKRDLMDPLKFQQRQYYQHRINEVLKEGKFI